MTARKRKPARKNTRRARGRRANRERPAAPYRTGETAPARISPPAGEGARAHGYAAAREAGYRRWFRFRGTAAGAPALTEPGDDASHVSGSGPATAERDVS